MDLAGHTVVYGGSFNPPHTGHQMACLYLLETLGADALWLVPSMRHPFGKELAPFEQRLEMCRLLAAPFGSRAVVSEVEAAVGATGRTYDTLVALRQQRPDLRWAFAVGSDILAETVAWHRWPDIVDMVQVVVMARAGYPSAGACPVVLPEVSSSDIRRRLRRGDSIHGVVPARVGAYIRDNGLYGSG